MPALAEWRDFYVMIGTSAGVIIGATFIVASLAANLKERTLGLGGFITPTAVHLGGVLFGSAVLAAPVLTPPALTVVLGSGGLAGAIYGIIVATRIWRMKLDLADRCFYVIMPILGYTAIVAAALLAMRDIELALETLAVAFGALLVIGTRNSWDMATFMITRDKDGV